MGPRDGEAEGHMGPRDGEAEGHIMEPRAGGRIVSLVPRG